MLSALVRQVVVEGLLSRTSATRLNPGAGMGLFFLAGAIGVLGLVFLSIAVYGLLLSEFAMPAAAAITGMGILILSGLCILGGRFALQKIQYQSHEQEMNKLNAVIDDLLQDVLTDLDDPIRESPKTALLLAGLAGFVAGDRLH